MSLPKIVFNIDSDDLLDMIMSKDLPKIVFNIDGDDLLDLIIKETYIETDDGNFKAEYINRLTSKKYNKRPNFYELERKIQMFHTVMFIGIDEYANYIRLRPEDNYLDSLNIQESIKKYMDDLCWILGCNKEYKRISVLENKIIVHLQK